MSTIELLTKKYGYSVGKVIYLVGASPRTVYRWISGEATPLAIYEEKLKRLLEREQRRADREAEKLLDS